MWFSCKVHPYYYSRKEGEGLCRRQDCVFGLFYLGKLCAVIMLTEIFIFSEEKEAQERKTQRQEKEEKE